MEYALGVYGDSIAFGYGNEDGSWFDKLEGFSSKIKMAQNGEIINNVLLKISADCDLAWAGLNFLSDFQILFFQSLKI